MPSYIVSSLIGQTGGIEGYRVVSIVRGIPNIFDCSTDKVISGLVAGNKLENASLNDSKTKLVFTAGSLSSYPRVSLLTGMILDKNGLTIVSSVVDDHGNVIGFVGLDGNGAMHNVTKKLMLSKAGTLKTCNWEVYTLSSGELSIRSKAGAFPRTKLTRLKEVKTLDSKRMSVDEMNKIKQQNAEANAYNEKIREEIRNRNAVIDKAYLDTDQAGLKSAVPVITDSSLEDVSSGSRDIVTASNRVTVPDSANVLPGIVVYNLADVLSSEFNTSAQDKSFLIKANLARIAPYYHMMFESIKRVFTTAVPTMGVTEDTLYINPKFLVGLSIGEATFVFIHEMLHLACAHPLRCGKRNAFLWNIATDIWINETICRDYGCKFGQGEASIEGVDGKFGVIKTPDFGLFVINEGIDLDTATETPETIYSQLLKENPQYTNNKSGQGQGQSQSGQGQSQSGQGQSGQGQDGVTLSQDKFDRLSSGWGDDFVNAVNDLRGRQGQSDQSQNGQSQSGQSQSGQSQSGQSQSGQGKGLGTPGVEVNGKVDDSDLRNETVDTELIYKGKKIAAKVPRDIFTGSDKPEDDYSSKDSVKSRVEKTKNALNRIRIKKQMDEETKCKKYSLTSGGVICEREIDFELAPRFKWQTILRKAAKTEYSKVYTFSKPKKALLQRGVGLPSSRKLGKPTKIPGLKICIDTSGSIDEHTLHRIFTQIQRILNEYNVDAEVVYWDTSVNNVGEFSDLKSLLKIKPLGSGGTDVKSAFDYLSGANPFQNKKEKTRIRDITLVLVFTDGAFTKNYGEYKSKFGSKTVWCIDGDVRSFTPLFGKVVPYEDN